MKKVDSILREVLIGVTPQKEEISFIKKSLEEFLRKLKKKISQMKIDAEIFVGGSYAKRTLIKKDKYDIDIFLRFGKKHKDKIQELAEKILEDFENVTIVHGSRDYFKIRINSKVFFEIVPVLKVKTPKEAENITDLSYSHVRYINKEIKSEKILDEIRVAKAFCYATECYGAESYVNGFSGYGIELLVYHYGSFLRFIQAVSKDKSEKIVIDIEKMHKNKSEILMNLNSSKLQSPIVLVDPTYSQRNVLAALSEETFRRFQKDCQNFLKNPSVKAFEKREIDFDRLKKNAEEKKQEFALLEIKTSKPEGDVAGSKLLKFSKYFSEEISRYFEIKNKGFEYSGKKTARIFFAVKSKKEILVKGPESKDKKNAERFQKEHRDHFSKKGRLYSKEKIKFNFKEFIEKWKRKNAKRIMKDMYIEGLILI